MDSTTHTRTASVIEVTKLNTHMRLLVKDADTKQRHYLLLHRTNLAIRRDDVLIYDDHAVIDSLTNSGITRAPIRRLVLYWDQATGKVTQQACNSHAAQCPQD